MKALKCKSEQVEFSDHKLLRVQIETTLAAELIDNAQPMSLDEEMITNEEIISKVNNRKINELTADEDLVSEWIDETNAMMSYRDFVIQKFGRSLLQRNTAGERKKKQSWYSQPKHYNLNKYGRTKDIESEQP